MKRQNKAVTFLLILLSAAGVFVGMKFLKQEQALTAARQRTISEVAQKLEPINQQRREWEKQEKQWEKTLKEKEAGRSCILLSFDNMSRELYDTIYDLMDQYGFRGTFLMRNGQFPSWERERGDDFSSSEAVLEMIDEGWDYAVSVGEEEETEVEETEYRRDFSDEFGDLALEQETETESETQAPETEPETVQETETVGFLGQLDAALARIAENGLAQPVTVFCDETQYAQVVPGQLAERGLTMAAVVDGEEKPAIVNEQEETLWKIDVGTYTQKDEEVEKMLDTLVAKQQSVAISINEVVKISKNDQDDLSLTRFTSLLNYLKELEADRKVNVLTYSEYYQYEQLRQQSYESALAEYAAFREEMAAELEELDKQEAEIARALQKPETAVQE